MIPLPIDPFLPSIVTEVRRARAAVVVAAPGAGKTTRVPPALAADGPVLLLQPRRVAARAIAVRVADERGWTVGNEVGWQVRFERRFGPSTQLLVATEGVLTARLQQDPLLSDFRTIVLDEFHERSIHADLSLALARQAWRARADLRIVIMSATIDAQAVAVFLDDCPVVDVPGRLFPLDVTYAPDQPMADAAAELLGGSHRQVLCFLPGALEIRRAMAEIERALAASRIDASVVPLYGALEAREQDEALRETDRRRAIVATNIAETSVTVPGVTAVVDSGLQKVARFDAERAIDSLDVERVTQDAADQRAGRAGRVAPGAARRLWDSRIKLRPHREPDIHRVDLSGVALDVIAWGGDPRRLEWFDPPRESALAAALALLEQLELTRNGVLTPAGRQAVRLPLHPRLARMLIAGGGDRAIVRACALISERGYLPPRTAATDSDLLSALDDWARTPPHVKRAADEIEALARGLGGGRSPGRLEFLRAILAGYPDRVARRRAPHSRELLLSSGAGATLAAESGVVHGEFLAAVDISSAKVRIASLVERDWLTPTSIDVVHRLDRGSGSVKAVEIERYGALPLIERPAAADPAVAAPMLADAWLERGPADDVRAWLRRMKFAGREVDLRRLAERAAAAARSLADLDIRAAVSPDVLRALDRDAPAALTVPSGRQVALEYGDDGSVSASVKLQELFGLAETPRVGPRREPVLLVLLAPNGRPVQMTRDLRSFWDRGYADVRKELRGRYPRHPWPEDPWTAPPTARAKRRRE